MKSTQRANQSNFRSARLSPPSPPNRSSVTRTGSYTFEGVFDGVHLEAKIELMGGFRYAFHTEAKRANLSGITKPVQVSLGIR